MDVGLDAPLRPVSSIGTEPSWATAQAITAVAEDLAGEFALRPLLERILLRCTQLLGCDAGSIASVDEAAGTYRKEADIGIRCQSGQVFPLSEGTTGAVVARRGPVWFDRYDDVRGGHVDAADRATLRSVIGVPLEWRGSITGVCVVFSRDDSRIFGVRDAELLQLFAKHAAVALTNARLHDVAEERVRAKATAAERERLLREVYETLNQGLVGVVAQLASAEESMSAGAGGDAERLVIAAHREARIALSDTRRTMSGVLGRALDDRTLEELLADEVEWVRRAGRLDARLVVAGQPIPLDPARTHEALRIAQEALANAVQHADATLIRLGVAYEPQGVSLLVQDDGKGFDQRQVAADAGSGLRRMTDRAHAVGALVELRSVPGWGTSLRVRFPTERREPTDTGVPLRVMVVESRPLVRAGVTRLLTQAGLHLEVVGEVAGTAEAVVLQEAVHADVVVASLDTADGEPDVADLTRALASAGGAAVLCLSEPGDDHRLAAALRAGARGCLDTSAGGAALVQAVLATARGEAFYSGTSARSLHRGLRPDGETLTSRELEVRALLERGLPDKAIAQELTISVKTVGKHVSSLLRKSSVRNRTELVALLRRP
ncbi:GAF domain-containing protein [Mycobacterium sp. NPDC006124]|uniref:hybrid sensor histidine kinase/response regulator transcription factor n=1 Tax=Mycobacterium sp. NPDC006124 TaxID=3156729 RepID=UPI0033B6F959